jgi:hypothetical protein
LASGLAGAQLIAVRSRLSALVILPYCHASFSQAQFIGNIVIWKSLAILSFENHWQYCHLVLRAGIMLIAFCAG